MSNGNPPVPTTVEAQALQSLLNVLDSATTPDMLQSQAILTRRLALQGDVIASRIPAPQNITEVGGYINLLTTLGLTDMRTELLASALGVASPTPALGWLQAAPTIGWAVIPNDRPAGAAQGSIPLTFQVRTDFAAPLQLALQGFHDRGCALPIAASKQALPAQAALVPSDLMPLLGRAFDLVPSAALLNPDSDALAVARLGTGAWQVVARCASTGPIKVAADQWAALTCTATACNPSAPPAAGRQYVPVAPVLSTAGFQPKTPGYSPGNSMDAGWARFVNVSGLVPGVTTLGSELVLLYPQNDVASSGLVSRLSDIWTGTVFAAH